MSQQLKLYKIRQTFPRQQVKNLEEAIDQAVSEALIDVSLPEGAQIAITAGSRGIANIVPLLKRVVVQLQQRKYKPFLVAAMGSHGRGESAGQKEVLTSLGITEEEMGVPVSCSDQVLEIGEVQDSDPLINGLPVYFAEEAYHADAVLIMNRVKPHTSFRGPYESGLLKMIAVGLGRAKGATRVHSLGAENLAKVIPALATAAIAKAPIIGGIAIVENAYDETAIIKGLPVSKFFEVERSLQEQSKRFMPSLPIKQADLCLVMEMGKNYSGTGMDTNIIGRMRIEGMPEPETPSFKYLGVLGLSEASHGNANGIGLADFTTEPVVQTIDKEATYLNCLTSGFVIRGAIPVTFSSDQALIEGAMQALKLDDVSKLNLMMIKNTLHIDEFWVSEILYDQLKNQEGISVLSGPTSLEFDRDGKLILK